MKLEYIKLENFALLRAGMNLSEIELDFRNAPNGINLIIGNNGTGKTGLLSNLHPFATLGHLEARDDQDLIIPGKDGRKFAIFSTKKHTYEIEHFYKWQGENNSRQIRSYFRKDGEELNKPGTVKSFLDIVQREMDIDINFLKLIRLGGNVKNFVELTSSERFTFMGKLLTAVDKYLSANKLFRSRSSALNTLLKNTIEKKDRLGISDILVAENVLSNRLNSLEKLKKEKESEIANFYTYKGKVNVEELEEADKKVNILNDEIDELRNQLDSLKQPKKVFIKTGLDVLELFNHKIEALECIKIQMMERYSRLLSEADSYDKDIDKLRSTSSEALDAIYLESTNELINKLEKAINDYEEMYKDNPTMTRDELKSDVDKINMIYFHYDNIMNLTSAGRRYFLQLMVDYQNNIVEIDEYLKNRLVELHTQKRLKSLKLPKKTMVFFVPSGCTESKVCPFYQAGTANKKDKETLEGIDSEIEKCEDASEIAQSFYSITKVLSMRDSDITEYTVSINTILNAILYMDKNMIVDRDKIQSILSHIEAYEEYQKNKDTREKMVTELEIQLSKSGGSTKEEVEELLQEIEAKRATKRKEVSSVREQLSDITKQINLTRDQMNEYTNSVKYNLDRQRINNDISVRKNELARLESQIELRDSYLKVKAGYDSRISELTYKIEDTEKMIEEDKMKIKLFKELEEDILQIQEKYDYITDLRDVTSLSDGIPLIHIKLYCRALCTIANEIIKNIYQGDFRIKKFDIKEGVFNIPYYTKGFTVKDIRDTSQAEASVAKLAISFAILSQFMTKYNIPLLDEVDGPMHQINKERFFSSIEGILRDTLKCEQAFLITQSTMFNEYPVNFIVTDSEYKHLIPKNATIIFQR